MAQNGETRRNPSQLNRSVTMAMKNKKAKRVNKPKISILNRQETTKVNVEYIGQVDSDIDTLVHRGSEMQVIPKAILQLKNLTKIDLCFTKVTEIPPEIAELSGLTSLTLAHNGMTSFDPKLCKLLSKLEHLSLQGNKLTTFPEEVEYMKSLRDLDLSDNKITMLPRSLYKIGPGMGYLKALLVQDNPVVFPPEEVVEKGLESVCEFLREGAVSGYKCITLKLKVVVLGSNLSSKTSAMNAVRNAYAPLARSETILTNYTVDSTSSMDYLRDLGLNVADVAANNEDENDHGMSIWEFSGGSEFFLAESFFVTSRTLTIVTVNVADDEIFEDGWAFYDNVWHHVLQMLSHVSRDEHHKIKIQVVATHTDQLSPEEIKLRLEELIRKMKRKSAMMKSMTEQRIENVKKSLEAVSCALCTNQRAKRNQDYYIDNLNRLRSDLETWAMLDLPTKAEDIIAVSSKDNTNIDLLVNKLESNKQRVTLPLSYVQILEAIEKMKSSGVRCIEVGALVDSLINKIPHTDSRAVEMAISFWVNIKHLFVIGSLNSKDAVIYLDPSHVMLRLKAVINRAVKPSLLQMVHSGEIPQGISKDSLTNFIENGILDIELLRILEEESRGEKVSDEELSHLIDILVELQAALEFHRLTSTSTSSTSESAVLNSVRESSGRQSGGAGSTESTPKKKEKANTGFKLVTTSIREERKLSENVKLLVPYHLTRKEIGSHGGMNGDSKESKLNPVKSMKIQGTFVQRKYKFDNFFCGSVFERVIARAGRDMDGERDKVDISRDWIVLRSAEGPETMVSLSLNLESKRNAIISVEGYRTDENQPTFIEYFNRFVWALETLVAEQYGGIDVLTTVSVDGGQEFDISELREAAATGRDHIKQFHLDWFLVPYDYTIATRGVRILSIDGGGVKGIVSLLLLNELQKHLNDLHGSDTHISEYFDMICGTSAGGIIACMVGILGIPVEECIDRYYDLSKRIFPRGLGRYKWHFCISPEQYDHNVLVKEVKSVIADVSDGNASMAMLQKKIPPRVFCVAKKEGANGPYLFRNYEDLTSDAMFEGNSRVQVWQAIRCTSAAPTYFKRARVGNDTFVDGALADNNPALVAYTEVRGIEELRDSPIDVLVSLGNGSKRAQDTKSKPSRTHIATLAKDIAQLAAAATDVQHVDTYLRRIFAELKRLKKQSFNYYRADPVGTVLENVQLDESNRMDELIEATQVWLEEEGSDMLRDAARDILQLY